MFDLYIYIYILQTKKQFEFSFIYIYIYYNIFCIKIVFLDINFIFLYISKSSYFSFFFYSKKYFFIWKFSYNFCFSIIIIIKEESSILLFFPLYIEIIRTYYFVYISKASSIYVFSRANCFLKSKYSLVFSSNDSSLKSSLVLRAFISMFLGVCSISINSIILTS